ncbi:SAM-dependent methyltransferase [Nonomuraea dietziae]|uniref:SAM-dependent methyltransferase n=1 Tax=Nonomuraea dietziae TaxID=65515 RepID=UPI0033D79174
MTDLQIDTTSPSVARIYDYWLGGKDLFEGMELQEPHLVPVNAWRTDQRPDFSKPSTIGVVAKAV